MLNKLIKAVSYFIVHLVVAVELYLLALLITSPVFNLVIGVMDLLNKGIFQSRNQFVRKYSNPDNLLEIQKILNIFILRRNKNQVLKNLPKKKEQIIL